MMKEMVYVVLKNSDINGWNGGNGFWMFDKVFKEKEIAEQYVYELNSKSKVKYDIAKLVPTEFADNLKEEKMERFKNIELIYNEGKYNIKTTFSVDCLHEENKSVCIEPTKIYYVVTNSDLGGDDENNCVESMIANCKTDIDKQQKVLTSMKKGLNKFENKFKFAQKVASLINQIYYEKDIEKKRKLVKDSLIVCQKSRHNIRNYEEMIDFIYNIKKTLKGFKGGFIDADAELYYMTKIYPIFRENGDEAFVYFLDDIK